MKMLALEQSRALASIKQSPTTTDATTTWWKRVSKTAGKESLVADTGPKLQARSWASE